MTVWSRRRFLGVAGAALLRPHRANTEPTPERVSAVTLAAADYVRLMPFATGDVSSDELAIELILGPRSEMLRRVLSDPTVDGGETSMLGHLLRVDRGDRSFVAVPVFPLRNFTARDIYVRKDASIRPDDLNGRRVGIYNWAASGAVWYRHFLRFIEQEPSKMRWLVGGTNAPRRITHRAPLPPYVSDAPSDRSLSDLLLAGDIDAMFVPLPPEKYHAINGPIVRLFPDFRSVETRYFEKTGCYPTQHVVVVRREVWEKDPSVGRRLVEAFNRCEAVFQERLHRFPYATPWEIAAVEGTDLLMGRDFHAHGLDENRREVDVFCQAGFDDGLTRRRIRVEEYFAELIEAS